MRHKHLGVFIIRFDCHDASGPHRGKLHSLLRQYHFASAVADGHGVARPLPEDTWALASFMSLPEISVFVNKIITVIPDFSPALEVMTRDDYFSRAFCTRLKK